MSAPPPPTSVDPPRAAPAAARTTRQDTGLGDALSPEDAGHLARAFAALSDPVRLRLLSMVAASGELCSCDLQGPLGRSQPTISHHTKALAEAGLITGEKRGRWTWWRVVPERVAVLRAALDTAP
jgi:ArsR family transcriptional regulator